ncbi:hypothetical protein N7449_008757 [Penicillium cf. viridicatum]|uniref:AB hydrolase-1 domain-containing protein n=1 Tax=Penicillium cf. viridicatum TaxID=2972119 RepID=A0A9W9JCT9_9EURO|nr:hypothetical protein N7449_008757 [Penicillium cf. viridicatum]
MFSAGQESIPPTNFKKGPHCVNLTSSQVDIANTSYVRLVRSVKIPSGTTYRYVFSPPFEDEKPYLLFLHGFPESSYEWHHQIEYFIQQGYGVIAPDLLGYGGTDNHSDLQSFSLKNMVLELGRLLDCEGIDKVVGVSHDLGSLLLSRVITYQPERLLAVAFLDIGYWAPGTNLNESTINAINNATQATVGYTAFGYWLFHNENDAGSIMDAHLDSVYTLVYTYSSTYWREDLAPIGKFKQWLLEDKTAPIGNFANRVSQEQWKSIMKAQGGLDGPLKWYKAFMRDVNKVDEDAIQSLSAAIQQPVLLILADRNPVGIPSLQLNGTVPYAADLRVRSVNSGHFLEVEAPQEVNRYLDSFLQDVLERNGLR